MSHTFGESAGRLAGLAGALLGWRPDEFWAATPAELACVVRAMGGGGTQEGVSAAELQRLREMYPDGGAKKDGPSTSSG